MSKYFPWITVGLYVFTLCIKQINHIQWCSTIIFIYLMAFSLRKFLPFDLVMVCQIQFIEQSSKLLLALPCTVVLGFGSRLDS
jgi:hypothetical protein